MMEGGDLAAGVRDLVTLDDDGVGGLGAEQVGRLVAGRIEGPEELAVFDVDFVDGVEGAQDLFVALEAEGAEEDGAEELALAVDADVEGVLLVVLELDPASRGRE